MDSWRFMAFPKSAGELKACELTCKETRSRKRRRRPFSHAVPFIFVIELDLDQGMSSTISKRQRPPFYLPACVAAQFVQAPLTVLFVNKKKSLSLGADGEALAGVGQGPIPKAGVI